MKKYCATDTRFRYVTRPDTHKPGGNGARNYGLTLAKGDYISWFDSDDLMHSDKLQIQLNLLQNNKDATVCVCSGQKVEKKGIKKRSLRKNFGEDLFKQIALNTSEIMTPSFIIKRSFLRTHSLRFDETLYRAQETDFLLRLSNVVTKKELIYTEEELFDYIFTEDSKSKGDEVYDRNYKWSRAKVYLDILATSKEKNYTEVFSKRLKRVLRIYFSALKNKDYNTANYILERLQLLLFKEFPAFYRQLRWAKALHIFLPLSTERVRNYFQKTATRLLHNFTFKE